jgi:RNA ligase (TIGR02306 family)
MPSEFLVEIVQIDEILEHPNADRLEFARVFGYHVVVGKGEYKAGDPAVYLPVDTVLPDKLRDQIFHGTRMTPVSRVRAAKIRGYVSQGMLIPISIFKWYYMSVIKGLPKSSKITWKTGTDAGKLCEIVKFTQPVKVQTGSGSSKSPTRYKHPDFKKYSGINHLLRYSDMFEDNESVWVTEKLHGMNFRAGWVPYRPKTRLEKVEHWVCKKILGLFGVNMTQWEWIVGSHNVQVDPKGTSNFARVARQKDLKRKIKTGHIWYGEMINTQNNYTYGLDQGELDVKFFDIWNTLGRYYLDYEKVMEIVNDAGEHVVPMLGGLMPYSLRAVSNILNSPDTRSALDNTIVPEGAVVRSVMDERILGQRKILKLLSEGYLIMKGNTEYH